MITTSLFLVFAAAPPPGYTLVDLGTLGGRTSVANAINGSADVVGTADGPDGVPRAFLWRDGEMIDIAARGGVPRGDSYGTDVSKYGVVVGYIRTARGYRGFHTGTQTRSPLQLIDAFGGNDTFVYAISDQAPPALPYIVGAASTRAGLRGFRTGGGFGQTFGAVPHAGLRLPYSAVLGVVPTNSSYSCGINYGFGGSGRLVSRAFVMYGAPEDIGTLKDDDSGSAVAVQMSLCQQVVGWSETDAGGGPVHAYRRDIYEGMVDLGTLGGRRSGALAINGHQEIVGWASTGQGVQHAFFYADSEMWDLDRLTRKPAGWTVVEARAVNDQRYIAGVATTPAGARHAILLRPNHRRCAGDVNGDGVVDSHDLAIVQGAGFCENPCDCPADVNADLFVNEEDVVLVLESFGACH